MSAGCKVNDDLFIFLAFFIISISALPQAFSGFESKIVKQLLLLMFYHVSLLLMIYHVKSLSMLRCCLLSRDTIIDALSRDIY